MIKKIICLIFLCLCISCSNNNSNSDINKNKNLLTSQKTIQICKISFDNKNLN